MSAVNTRKPSPLQRRVLIILAVLDTKRPGPVLTRDIERMLERSGDTPVYGPNLRASNLQLAVELTSVGRELSTPLLAAEQQRELTARRSAAVTVLPLSRDKMAGDVNTQAGDRPVQLDNVWHMLCRGDYVIRLDGTTCLQLWNSAGHLTRLKGDPLQVATWLQACHDAGIDIRVQINESTTPDEGITASSTPADQTDTWYCQLEASLLAQGITGLKDEIHRSVVVPGEELGPLPAPARLLHILRESPEAFPLSADSYEDDTCKSLTELLLRSGFTAAQARELQLHRIRWSLMDEKEFGRKLKRQQNKREE
ncbi:hypothetical protein IOM74_004279 [Salmonella enterica]|nr:hypothetical protein [Salmonella enterica]